jgi:hypothetical protein
MYDLLDHAKVFEVVIKHNNLEDEVRAIEALSFVTKLSFVPEHTP